MSDSWHNNYCRVYNKLYNVPILMKYVSRLVILVSTVFGMAVASCNRGNTSTNEDTAELTEAQKNLMKNGWFRPKTETSGEQAEE